MRNTVYSLAVTATALVSLAGPLEAQLPDPGMVVDDRTALVITDPQNDFLSPDGVAWGVVGASVEENHTVEHLGQLPKATRDAGLPVFVLPHYCYPKTTNGRWGERWKG